MSNFDFNHTKQLILDICFSYPGAIFFIVFSIYFFFYVRKNDDKNSLGIISPYYEGISASILTFCMGIAILIYKIFYEK